MLSVGSFPPATLSVPEFQNMLAKVYNKDFILFKSMWAKGDHRISFIPILADREI